MSPYIVQEAKHRGIKLLLLSIPREVMEQQAVDKGDIRFFELAHVEVNIQRLGERKIQIELTDFAFPYAELIPEDVREKIVSGRTMSTTGLLIGTSGATPSCRAGSPIARARIVNCR